jgi:hypothetical protein
MILRVLFREPEGGASTMSLLFQDLGFPETLMAPATSAAALQ